MKSVERIARGAGLSTLAIIIGACFSINQCLAEAVMNGNELALELCTGDKQTQPQTIRDHLQKVHTFRYLKVIKVGAADDQRPGIRFETVEPSSDMTVIIYVRPSQKVSYTLAKTVTTNDCIRLNGRIVTIEMDPTPLMKIDPAIVQSKDRDTPKGSKEMLKDVDATAH